MESNPSSLSRDSVDLNQKLPESFVVRALFLRLFILIVFTGGVVSFIALGFINLVNEVFFKTLAIVCKFFDVYFKLDSEGLDRRGIF